MVFTIVASLVLRSLWARENSKRDKDAMASSIPRRPESPFDEIKEEVLGSAESRPSILEGVMHVDKDLTDWEDKNFRYSL
jgi:hypothetical protein